MVKVRFMSLSGVFKTVDTIEYPTSQIALDAVKEYARVNGFTNVKVVEDGDYTTRYTATTPQGRYGRNIAYLEPINDY